MIANSLNRFSAILASIILVVLLATPALPALETAPPHSSLAGQLLVAASTISDPRFHHAVILMGRHDRKGGLGIVVNRPLGERPLAALLEALGDKETAAARSVRIFAGGPVQPEAGFVLHSGDYRRVETVDIDAHVAMTSSRE